MPLYRRILTMSALALSVFIGSLDQTIVVSSNPAIAKAFDAMNSISWVTTAFLLASTAMQPLYGRLSDIFGRIETLMAGLVVFLVGSAICGAAKSFGMLVGGRVIQGLGASGLLSLVMVIVSDISIERERAKVTSVFAAIWAASSVLGPVFGGLFTQSKGGWRWVFYFSLPVGGLAGIFILTFLRLPRPAGSFKEKLRRVDFAGIVILVSGVVMIMLALNFGGGEFKWASPTVLCLLIFGILVVGIFVAVEWRIPAEPIMPIRLFKNRNVGIALALQFFMGATIFGPAFYIPIYFNITRNSSAIGAGLHLLPFLLPLTIFSTITGFIVSKTGRYREPAWVGAVILTAGICLLVLFNEHTTTGQSIGILIVSGAGLGILMQPSLLALQTAIQPRDMATGTTLYVALRSFGGSIVLSVLQAVLTNSLTRQLKPVYAEFSKYKDVIAMAVDNQGIIYSDLVPAELRIALVKAYVKALRTVFYALIPFSAMVLIMALFFKHIPLRTRMAKTIQNVKKE
ncbi:major facilitator superfamily domain-containing protein [Coemansia spiralis]|nr:major facilitator superfamily domain-containing protein [Coemansia spiralis]